MKNMKKTVKIINLNKIEDVFKNFSDVEKCILLCGITHYLSTNDDQHLAVKDSYLSDYSFSEKNELLISSDELFYYVYDNIENIKNTKNYTLNDIINIFKRDVEVLKNKYMDNIGVQIENLFNRYYNKDENTTVSVDPDELWRLFIIGYSMVGDFIEPQFDYNITIEENKNNKKNRGGRKKSSEYIVDSYSDSVDIVEEDNEDEETINSIINETIPDINEIDEYNGEEEKSVKNNNDIDENLDEDEDEDEYEDEDEDDEEDEDEYGDEDYDDEDYDDDYDDEDEDYDDEEYEDEDDDEYDDDEEYDDDDDIEFEEGEELEEFEYDDEEDDNEDEDDEEEDEDDEDYDDDYDDYDEYEDEDEEDYDEDEDEYDDDNVKSHLYYKKFKITMRRV